MTEAEASKIVSLGVWRLAAGAAAGLVVFKTWKKWKDFIQHDKQLPPLVSFSRQDVAQAWLEGLFWKVCLLAAKEAEEVWGSRVFRMPGAGFFEQPKVYCTDPAYTDKVLGADGFEKHDESYEALKDTFGQGHNCLITRKMKDNYLEIRKPIMHFFSLSNMKKRLNFCQQKLQGLVTILETAAENQSPVELSDLFCNVAVDIIGIAAFAHDFEALEGGSSIGLDVAHSLPFLMEECGIKQRFIPFRKYMTFLPDVKKAKQMKDKNLSFCKDLLRRRREETAGKAPDLMQGHLLIDMLINSPYESEVARAADASAFLVAGHETVGAQLSWCVYCLVQNPECLKKAQEEVDNVMSSSMIPQVSMLTDLKYASACFKESLRLWPTTPEGSGRICPEDVKIDKYHIPKGTQITMSNIGILRSKLWSDPDSFRPERWFDNSNEALDLRKKAFVAFSRGPRQCPGMNFATLEGPLVIATVLRNFSLAMDRPLPIGKEMLYHTTGRPRGGLWVQPDLR